jgi:hypothetical protein
VTRRESVSDFRRVEVMSVAYSASLHWNRSAFKRITPRSTTLLHGCALLALQPFQGAWRGHDSRHRPQRRRHWQRRPCVREVRVPRSGTVDQSPTRVQSTDARDDMIAPLIRRMDVVGRAIGPTLSPVRMSRLLPAALRSWSCRWINPADDERRRDARPPRHRAARRHIGVNLP